MGTPNKAPFYNNAYISASARNVWLAKSRGSLFCSVVEPEPELEPEQSSSGIAVGAGAAFLVLVEIRAGAGAGAAFMKHQCF